jgi:hypothetical protein
MKLLSKKKDGPTQCTSNSDLDTPATTRPSPTKIPPTSAVTEVGCMALAMGIEQPEAIS